MRSRCWPVAGMRHLLHFQYLYCPMPHRHPQYAVQKKCSPDAGQLLACDTVSNDPDFPSAAAAQPADSCVLIAKCISIHWKKVFALFLKYICNKKYCILNSMNLLFHTHEWDVQDTVTYLLFHCKICIMIKSKV